MVITHPLLKCGLHLWPKFISDATETIVNEDCQKWQWP